MAGHTRATIVGDTAYIRHLSYADQIGYDEQRQRFFDEARAMGVPTDEERAAALLKAGEWTEEKERELTQAKQFVESLQEGSAKARSRMPSMVKDYLRKIADAQKEYEDKMQAKYELMGITCESSADREVNDYYILSNLFADPGLTTPLFTEEEFGYFSQGKVNAIAEDYRAAMEGCSEVNIKRLAMSPVFQQYFNLVGDDLKAFFGKPICALTFYQRDVLRYGTHFRNIYQNNDVSKWKADVLEDPDLLIEYASTVNAKKEELAQQGANEEGTVVVGAQPEDIRALGVKGGNPIEQIAGKFKGNFMDWAATQGKGIGP